MTKIVDKLFITVILIIFFSMLFFLSPSNLEIRPNIQINSDFTCVIDVSIAKLSFNNLKIKIYNKKIKNISLKVTDDTVYIDSVKVSKLIFSKVFEIQDKGKYNEDIVLSSVKYYNLINIYYFCILALFFVFLTLLITIFKKRIASLININKINVSLLSKIIGPDISGRKLFHPFLLNKNDNSSSKILNYSYLVFFLLTIILGVYLRLYTGPGVDLWFDEAYRAVGYVENGFTHWATVIDKIRPIGYTFLTYIIQKIHNTDFMLRLPSLIAGILTIFVVWGISNRIFGDPDKPVKSRIAILLSVFLVSFNPTLIGFSKEFKPYALELFLHLLLIYLLLLYLQNNTYRNLLFLLFSSFISIFFAYNIIFALPIILIIVLLKSLGDKNNENFILICLTIVIIIISFTIIKVNLVGSIIESKNESSEFWGNKYDVFITDDETGFVHRIKWYYTKTADIIEYSTKNLIFIDLPVKINSFFNIFLKNISILLLFLGSIILFIKRKIPYVLLFFLPIVIVIILNVLKIWTYGNFRANLFIYGYFLFIVLFGINFLLESKEKILRYAIVSFIVVFYFILQFPYNFNFYRTKVVSVPTYNAMELVNFLYNHERLLDDEYKKTIYTDLHVSDPLKYYVNYNKDTAPKYNKLYREEFRNYSEVIPIFRIPLEDSEKMVVEALKKEKFIYFCFLYNSFSPLYDFNTKEDKRLFALVIFNKYSNVKQYILDTNVIFYCESTIFDEYAK